eukprot:jgi/Chrzof1/13198/Cz07g24040.t1
MDYFYKQYCDNAERSTPDDFYTRWGSSCEGTSKVPGRYQYRQGNHQDQEPLGHNPRTHVSASDSPHTQHRRDLRPHLMCTGTSPPSISRGLSIFDATKKGNMTHTRA